MPMSNERREQWRERMAMPADADPVQVQILEELRLARRQRSRGNTRFSLTRVFVGVLFVLVLLIYWPAAIVLLLLVAIMSAVKR